MVHRTQNNHRPKTAMMSNPTVFMLTFILFLAIFDPLMSYNSSAISISVDDMDKRLIYIEEGHLVRGSVGNLIPSRPGNEIATCSSNGILAVTYGSDNSWKTEIVFTAYHGTGSSERARINSIMTGDVYPELPGDEILTVDDDGSLRMSYHDGSNWKTERLFRDVNWLYEVDQGDIDGDGQPEIVVVGEEQHLVLLKREGDKWISSILASVPFYIEACRIEDLEPDHPGKEILFGGGKGVLWMAFNDGTGYEFKELVDLGSPVTDITTIDMDPLYPGPEVFVSTRDGKVYVVRKDQDGNWLKEIIHNEEEIIYGMESGYLDPDKPVLLFASYKHRMGLIEHDLLYRTHVVHKEEWNILGCAIGDLDPIHPGSEIFSLSQLGRLTMIFKDIPGLRIDLPMERTRVNPGEEVSIPIHIMALGDLKDEYDLSVESSFTTTIDPKIASGSIVATLTFVSPMSEGEYDIEIITSTGGIIARSSLSIDVREGSDMVRFQEVVLNGVVIKDRQTMLTITSISDFGLSEPFMLLSHKVPTGMNVHFSRSICDPCETPDSIVATISVDTGLYVDRYVIFVIGVTDEDIVRAVALVIDVMKVGIQNFRMETVGRVDGIPDGGTGYLEIRLISENGFDEEVELSIEGLIPGIDIELSETIVVPTSNVSAMITGNITGGPYIAMIIARSENIERIVYVRIGFITPDMGIYLTGPEGPVNFRKMDDGKKIAEFVITAVPGSSPPYEIVISNGPLPDGWNISYDPSNIRTLPYPLNITVRVWGINGPDHWTLNISLLDTVNVLDMTIGVEMSKANDEEIQRRPNHFLWAIILILIISFLAVLSTIAYIFRDDLKKKERSPSSNVHRSDSKDGKHSEVEELRYGIGGRVHRRNDRK